MDLIVLGHLLADAFDFDSHFVGLLLVISLGYMPCQEGVQQAALLGLQVRLLAAKLTLEVLAVGDLVLQRRPQGLAEPVGKALVGYPECLQFRDDGRFKFLRPPGDDWVVLGLVPVAAAVVDVFLDAAVLLLLLVQLARHGAAAVGAAEEPPGQGQVDLRLPAFPALQDVLAGFEGSDVDDRPVLAGEDAAVPGELADVEGVVQDVGDRTDAEAWRGIEVVEAFLHQFVRNGRLRHFARGVQFEHPAYGQGADGVNLDGFVLVLGIIDIADGGMRREPALGDFFVHPFQALDTQVVAVELRDAGQDIVGELTHGSRLEVVLDEEKLHAVAILEFLEAHGVLHVAGGAVDLVRDQPFDVLLLRVALDPVHHLVELLAFGAFLGRLGPAELLDDVPAFLRGPLLDLALLGVDGVALVGLLLGADPRPDDDVLLGGAHDWDLLLISASNVLASQRTLPRISRASLRETTRP